jgi:hypothetical protein
MSKKARGRMINQNISLSTKVASLSPESLALFCLLIPHFDAHGKMLANPHLIKGLVCPLVEWLNINKIEKCLKEVNDKTNVKFWKDANGIHYLHSLNWKDHQELREDRLGPDRLPDYSGTTPGLVPLEVEVEVEGKGKGEDKHLTSILDELFREFWSAYPKKIGKGAAEKAFKKAKPTALLSAKMVQAIERQKASQQWQKNGGQFIPNPSTWLNQKRWEDDLQPAGSGVRERNHQAARDFCDE